jgi:hypothetical protein
MGGHVDEVAKDAPSQPSERPAAVSPTTPEPSGKEKVDAQSLAGIFGVRGDSLSPKQVEKINSIVSWVRQTSGSEDTDIAWAIVQKRNQLGSPRLGVSVIDHMYQWYVASKEYEEAQAKLRAVELGNG